jgi:hypothetical protein
MRASRGRGGCAGTPHVYGVVHPSATCIKGGKWVGSMSRFDDLFCGGRLGDLWWHRAWRCGSRHPCCSPLLRVCSTFLRHCRAVSGRDGAKRVRPVWPPGGPQTATTVSHGNLSTHSTRAVVHTAALRRLTVARRAAALQRRGCSRVAGSPSWSRARVPGLAAAGRAYSRPGSQRARAEGSPLGRRPRSVESPSRRHRARFVRCRVHLPHKMMHTLVSDCCAGHRRLGRRVRSARARRGRGREGAAAAGGCARAVDGLDG